MARLIDTVIPEKVYYSIREVSRITKIKPYILRYWEAEFHLLRPARRESGQRKYTQKDIEQILKIKELLYARRFTLEGAKKIILEESRRGPTQLKLEFADSVAAVSLLQEAKKEVAEILKIFSHKTN